MTATCDGKGKLPCLSCSGTQQTLTTDGRPVRCLTCGGKGRIGLCPGCPACSHKKQSRASAEQTGRFKFS